MDIASTAELSNPLLFLPSAYLLVSHGSRDPRPQEALGDLAQLFLEKVQLEIASAGKRSLYSRYQTTSLLTAKPLVGTACLELAPLPLHQQIQQFGEQAIALGYKRLQVVPLFLLAGVHVMDDIPAEIAIAQAAFGTNLKIDLCNYLGSHPKLIYLLANEQNTISATAWVLIAHGSSRSNAKQPIEAIAKKLNAVAAYWSVPPSLETQVEGLINSGNKRIGILPYFLFAGGITDAIARVVEQLSRQFPSSSLHLAAPMGSSPQLADLIWDLTVE